MIRQALIPAGGRGLRLDRPGTPKPLVDVGGLPIIVRLIGQLEQVGVQRIVVVVGFEGEKIGRALKRNPSIKAEIHVVSNPDWDSGLAKSLLSAKGLFDGPFYIGMADHVFDEKLIRAVADKAPGEGGVSALVDPRLDDVFALDSAVKVRLEGAKIVEIGRNLKDFDAVDAGFFVARPELFDALEQAVSIERDADLSDALQLLAAQNQVQAIYAHEGHWDDVDTPSDLIHAEMRLRSKRRLESVRRPRRRSAQVIASDSEFEFIAGAPIKTRIVIQRGLVKNPSRYQIIPDDAASSPIFVFTDETVGELYGAHFVAELRKQGYDIQYIVLPEGEESKSLANYLYLVERVLSRGVDEKSVFISLGGGVVCNVCGFIASTIYRGLGLIHLPTTLMAQCDAAISHKQAINGQRGKNMVGSYFSPLLVAVDVEVLQTLSRRLMGDGIAEGIKHALGQDASYIEMLLSHRGELEDLDFLEEIVRRNVALKCGLAASDPKELREAMILQYGHTVGHAVEHLTGYRLYHGESVAVGMVVAARVARLLGACSDELVELHIQLAKKFGLPTMVPAGIRVGDVLDSLRYNKRYLTEGTRMALLADVGSLWNVDDDFAIPVSDQVLAEAVELSREKEE